ncbi:MAG: hypothetical protein EBR02_02290 [Alphaproteobacteria bacterium]|nr:hypothetical protein [Alphaproteobacteria bacterium]
MKNLPIYALLISFVIFPAIASDGLKSVSANVEKLEKKKGHLNQVPNIRTKLDDIRHELLQVQQSDPDYPIAVQLMDRYMALDMAIRKEANKPPSKQELARIAREEAKEKRSQGVSVGMAKEDVLASSWGRPQSKNVTTGVYGTHEQWVYRSSNYLYFENDILTSIQTQE